MQKRHPRLLKLPIRSPILCQIPNCPVQQPDQARVRVDSEVKILQSHVEFLLAGQEDHDDEQTDAFNQPTLFHCGLHDRPTARVNSTTRNTLPCSVGNRSEPYSTSSSPIQDSRPTKRNDSKRTPTVIRAHDPSERTLWTRRQRKLLAR
jgi:hypothetical protein